MIRSPSARRLAAFSALARVTAAGITILVCGASVTITPANDSDEGLGFMAITESH